MKNDDKYEIEMKFPMPHYGEDELISRLKALGASDGGKFFENNILFDTQHEFLSLNNRLLRLREYKNKYIITLKDKSNIKGGKFKIREEIETHVSDLFSTLEIFKRMGYNVKLIYQKYRRKMIIDKSEITIDNLPFGDYIEIEGSKESIEKLSEELELLTTDISNKSYVSLYCDICRKQNITPSPHIIFDNYDISKIIEFQ